MHQVTETTPINPSNDLPQRSKRAREEVNCAICLDWIFEPILLPCEHLFCKDCIIQATKYHLRCPLCRFAVEKVTMDSIVNEEMNEYLKRINPNYYNSRKKAQRIQQKLKWCLFDDMLMVVKQKCLQLQTTIHARQQAEKLLLKYQEAERSCAFEYRIAIETINYLKFQAIESTGATLNSEIKKDFEFLPGKVHQLQALLIEIEQLMNGRSNLESKIEESNSSNEQQMQNNERSLISHDSLDCH